MAAAVAFYAAFSLAPTLVIVIVVAGAVFGTDAVQGRLYGEIRGLIGPDGAAAVQALVATAWTAARPGVAVIASTLAIVAGASATFSELNASLNTIFAVPRAAVGPGWWSLVRVRLLSFGLVLGIAFLLIVLLVFDTALGALLDWVWRGGDSVRAVVQAVRRVTTFVALVGAFAVLLRVLPDRRVRWRRALAGATVAAVLFAGGRSLFGWYLTRLGATHAFGAAGSFAAVLMWLYYSAGVFLFGAEVAVPPRARSPS